MINRIDTEEITSTKIKDVVDSGKILVLHNDDYNSFEHVENCLIKICKHSVDQAAQCALIVHFKGKCDVKKGVEKKLKQMYLSLKLEGLSVTIED